MVRDCQYGFIRGKSCTSANLLEVLDHVGSLLDDGKQVDMIYMDMSKSFDKVKHGCLLQKLHEFRFGGSLLQWFSSYLMGRYQRVTVLGETSDTLPVSSGIPQGSILGPMLFLIYVNNLPDSVSVFSFIYFTLGYSIYIVYVTNRNKITNKRRKRKKLMVLVEVCGGQRSLAFD